MKGNDLFYIAVMFFCLLAKGGYAQGVRISPNCPEYGRGGHQIKVTENGRRLIFGVPSQPNMYNIYFNFCVENLPRGDFYLQALSDNPNHLPGMAVYRFDEEDEWCFAPLEDSATYRIDVPKKARKMQFASGIPYSYGDMLSHIESLPDEFVHILEVEKRSIGGLPVKVLKITDCNIADEGKQAIWIMGGQHPFELPGLQTVRRSIDFMVSNHPIADELRRRAIVYICPIVDVDASFKGLSGKRIVGRGTKSHPVQDLNWDWNVTLNSKHPVKNTKGGPNAYDNISHPQVKGLQELIYAISTQNPLRFFIDHHSPFPLYDPTDDTLAFHIIDKYLPSSKKSYSQPQSFQRRFWDLYETKMGFRPVVLADPLTGVNSAYHGKAGFSYSHGPGEQFDYERSADYWVDSDNALYYRNTLAQPNMFFATTIETGWYHTPYQNTGPYDWWDSTAIMAHAEALFFAMLELIKEIPGPTKDDRIIDISKDKKSFKFKGEWKEVATQIPNTIIHHVNGLAYATQQKGSSIEMSISPTKAGVYDIYLWSEPMYKSPFNPLPNQCISDANVQIRIFDGEQQYYQYVDQTIGGGQWRKITTLYLDPAKQPTMVIAKISDDNRLVVADAIRLTPSDGLPQTPVSYRD